MERKRLEVRAGDEYDEENCSRIGGQYGKVTDILLQGYKVNDEIKASSIVLVGES